MTLVMQPLPEHIALQKVKKGREEEEIVGTETDWKWQESFRLLKKIYSAYKLNKDKKIQRERLEVKKK